EAGVLIEHVQPARRILAMQADEIRILQQAFEPAAHLFAASRTWIALQDRAAVGDELVEFVCHGHHSSRSLTPSLSRIHAPRASLFGASLFGGAPAGRYISRMFGLPRTHQRPRNVRLDTLIRLRWLAVCGQLAAVVVVHFGLEFEVPIWACLAVIALAALLNVALRMSFRHTQWLEPDPAALLLTFGIAELAALF